MGEVGHRPRQACQYHQRRHVLRNYLREARDDECKINRPRPAIL